MFKRPICKAIGCLLLVVILLTVAIPVLQVFAAHENTYTNTGNQRQDLIGVALTQVGYMEGWNNDTKYGAWYSTAVGYYMNNQPWCGMFISWCANQAGIPTSVIGLSGWAYLEAFGITDIFTYGSGRAPQPGDLFSRDGVHAGIVYQVNEAEGYFLTIEGNTYANGGGEGVYIRTRYLNDSRYTYYFGSPKYTSDHAHDYGQLINEDAHPHKEYKVCTICGNKLFTGNTKTVADCITCIQENCTHSYEAWQKASDSQHKHACSICGKEETANHNWNGGTVTKTASCKEAGSKDQTCQSCGAQRTVELPKLQTHTYTKWSKVDEEVHSRKCLVCNKVDEQEHNCPEEWSVSDNQHWFECADCVELVDLGEHDFNDSCENPCEICGYTRESGHRLHESWDMSENGHYYGCELCPHQVDFAPHTFSLSLTGDEDGHYYACTVCGYKDQLQAHTPGAEATEEAAQLCTVCDFEIAPKKPHVHSFLPILHDQHTHWGSCECGDMFGPEEHQWDISSKACAICKRPMQVQKTQIPWFWINVAVCGVAGLIVLTVLVVVILLVVKKKNKKKVLQEV